MYASSPSGTGTVASRWAATATKAPMTNATIARSRLNRIAFTKLVERILRTPVCFVFEPRLFFFSQNKSLGYQRIHLCSHEASVTIFGRAHHRFPPNIEAGIYNYRAAGLSSERINYFPVKRVCISPDGLNPC